MYDPATGRFLSEDPTQFDGADMNLYRYAKNDPMTNMDPTGECSQPTFVPATSYFESTPVMASPVSAIAAGVPAFNPATFAAANVPAENFITENGVASMVWNIGDGSMASPAALQTLQDAGSRYGGSTPTNDDAAIASLLADGGTSFPDPGATAGGGEFGLGSTSNLIENSGATTNLIGGSEFLSTSSISTSAVANANRWPNPLYHEPTGDQIGPEIPSKVYIDDSNLGSIWQRFRDDRVINALTEGDNRLSNAADLLANHGAAVQQAFQQSAVANKYLSNPEVRSQLLSRITTLQGILHDPQTITQFQLDVELDSGQKERHAEAWTSPITSVIHLNPLFWDGSQPLGSTSGSRASTMLHELGRQYLGLFAPDNSGDWNDVYLWDNLISSLNDQRGHILAIKSPSSPPRTESPPNAAGRNPFPTNIPQGY